MTVKTHPLAEILSKALFGIHGVPEDYSRRMVARAIKKAVEWHEANKDTPTIDGAPTGSVKCPKCGGNITKSGLISYCNDCCKVFG